jgi:phosphoribosylformylglycinamidine synthase
VELNLDNVPQRETGMTAYEMMLSESQERMLMILKPGKEKLAEKIFKKWELDFAVIGKLTRTGRMVLKHGGKVVGDLPIDPLAKAAPEYARPWVPSPKLPVVAVHDVREIDWKSALKTLMACPDLASRRWVWQQYDHTVMADTIQRPGGDAAVVRIHGTNRGLAISTDCTPRYVQADPVEGGKQAVAETWRNITAVGAKPLAITDNMNFGNPEKPAIMGQFVGAVQGIGAACNALSYPVVSGNVSLYNETDGRPIMPTPAIGGVGVLDDLSLMTTLAFKRAGETIVLIGQKDAASGWLGQSLYLREVCGQEKGAPPPVDLAHEKAAGNVVRDLIARRLVTACHDLSDGGLMVALAEMALAGGVGCTLADPGAPRHGVLFGEDQGRYVVTCKPSDAKRMIDAADEMGVPAKTIGTTGGSDIGISGAGSIAISALRELHEGWFPTYMAS